MPDRNEDVERLHVNCVTALRRYIGEANKTCKLLMGIGRFPVNLQTRTAILEQRQVENDAHMQYQIAREDLFKAAQWS
jgi:hypothetical protein